MKDLKHNWLRLALILISSIFFAVHTNAQKTEDLRKTGNVIFIHPDGVGLQAWNAFRFFKVGPDGKTNWDKLPRIAIYRSHALDGLAVASQAGATIHAYGIKVNAHDFGMRLGKKLKSASGFNGSIMHEAKARGKSIGIINSGHICEPGSAVFLASVLRRHKDRYLISKQIIESGAEVVMSGGEAFLLPEGVKGFHGRGLRKDGRNLITISKNLGYTVVYTREQLLSLDLRKVKRLLGVFGRFNTYNSNTEEVLEFSKLPSYNANAPSIAEMLSTALKILSRNKNGFMLVAEEEGTDNFANSNNARGFFQALSRADEAYAKALGFLKDNPNTLLITCSDSDAGGMQVSCPALSDAKGAFNPKRRLPNHSQNGAPLDGREGTNSKPFLSAPNKRGSRFAFGVTWAEVSDLPGGVIARAAGMNSEFMPNDIDNTYIYRLMYLTLFGKLLP